MLVSLSHGPTGWRCGDFTVLTDIQSQIGALVVCPQKDHNSILKNNSINLDPFQKTTSKTFAMSMFGTYANTQQQDKAALSKLTAFDSSFEAKNTSLPKASENKGQFEPAAIVSLPVFISSNSLMTRCCSGRKRFAWRRWLWLVFLAVCFFGRGFELILFIF